MSLGRFGEWNAPTELHTPLTLAGTTMRRVLSPGARADDSAEATIRLYEVMAALPNDQREVVLMRFVDDMSLDEIAQTLSVPTGTVKSRLHRALETLRTDPHTREYFLG